MDINGYSLDSENPASITANVNTQANQTNQDIANQYTGDAKSAGRGLLNSTDNFNNGLSFGDKAQTQAIQSRYTQAYNRGESALSLDALKNAQSDHIRNLQIATQAAGQEVELNRQKAIMKWNIEQQNKKARGAILGTTLGIVGGVVGGVVGAYGTAGVGTAAGAAAGYAAGQGVGQAVGSS